LLSYIYRNLNTYQNISDVVNKPIIQFTIIQLQHCAGGTCIFQEHVIFLNCFRLGMTTTHISITVGLPLKLILNNTIDTCAQLGMMYTYIP
jgi:hypothetical protein